jgi:integrase/recombinase XerC
VPPKRRSLVEHFLSGHLETTTEAYRGDLEIFAAWLGQDSLDGAARAFFSTGKNGAHEIALEYRAHMLTKYAPATVNRRLASLRSLVKVARLVSGVTWHLEVRNVPSQAYRDTRGPGAAGYLRLLAELEGSGKPKAKRDRVILHLLFDAALRRKEVCGLDVSDVDASRSRLRILGKGRRETEWVTLPAQAFEAIHAWVEVRGGHAGALLTSLDPAKKGDGRLTGKSVWRIVSTLGKKAGVEAWPHGLRHAAITEVLDGGVDVREAKKFSRHKRIETLLIYDDARRDVAGQLAQDMADRVYKKGEDEQKD